MGESKEESTPTQFSQGDPSAANRKTHGTSTLHKPLISSKASYSKIKGLCVLTLVEGLLL